MGVYLEVVFRVKPPIPKVLMPYCKKWDQIQWKPPRNVKIPEKISVSNPYMSSFPISRSPRPNFFLATFVSLTFDSMMMASCVGFDAQLPRQIIMKRVIVRVSMPLSSLIGGRGCCLRLAAISISVPVISRNFTPVTRNL